MTDEELARIKQETIGATDTEYLAPSDVWGLILRLELAESVCKEVQLAKHSWGDYCGRLVAALEAWKRARAKT